MGETMTGAALAALMAAAPAPAPGAAAPKAAPVADKSLVVGCEIPRPAYDNGRFRLEVQGDRLLATVQGNFGPREDFRELAEAAGSGWLPFFQVRMDRHACRHDSHEPRHLKCAGDAELLFPTWSAAGRLGRPVTLRLPVQLTVAGSGVAGMSGWSVRVITSVGRRFFVEEVFFASESCQAGPAAPARPAP